MLRDLILLMLFSLPVAIVYPMIWWLPVVPIIGLIFVAAASLWKLAE